jgi:ribosomal protein S18 acetylase RimI-like enzyme
MNTTGGTSDRPVAGQKSGPALATPKGGQPAAPSAPDEPRGPSLPWIRPVRPSEIAQVAALDEKIFGNLAYPFFVLRQLYDVHQDDLLVLEDEGLLRGYSIGAKGATAGLGWLLGLGVEPASRGLGHGERLMRASFDRFADHGVDRVRLTVDGENAAAVGLYQKLGFTLLQEVEDYLGPGESRLLLEASVPAVTGRPPATRVRNPGQPDL